MKLLLKYLSVVVVMSVGAGAYAQNIDQQEQYDIFSVLNRFVISNAAAGQCYKPTMEEQKAFGVQYLSLMIQVENQIVLQNPEATKEDIDNEIKARIDPVTFKVEEEIKANGCDTKIAKGLVELYKFHSTLDLMAPALKHQK